MKLLAIGDVGVISDVIHLGDEAMFEELVTQLRLRGVEHFVGISANPADTSSRYGIESIARIGFDFRGPDARARMRERMSTVLDALDAPGRLEPGDPAHAVIAAVRDCDAVAIAGGGNLASTWPLHVFERATLVELATRLGKPVVITGQTLGPDLDDEDAALVRRMLSSARLVGVRERASHALALALGAAPERLEATIDDASFLGADAEAVPAPAASFCLVSLSLHVAGVSREVFVSRVAELLDDIAATGGLEIRFLAHFGSTSPGTVVGDAVLHEEVRERMRRASAVIVPTTATAAAGLARSADIVVTSRYHPAVFAVSAGVPTLAISVDEYTSIKLHGALGNFAQSSVITSAEVGRGEAVPLARSLWADRARIRAAGQEAARINRDGSARWWDRVARSIGAVVGKGAIANRA